MINNNERSVDPFQEMLHLTQSFLNLNTWGFKESYHSVDNKCLIYDSDWCRLSVTWGGWDPRGGNSISIYYGRLLAPNETATMVWNGEECHCWHREELALHFLDGLRPEDSAKSIYTHKVIEQYKVSVLGQSLSGKRRQPEWLIRMHAAIWEEYAPRLFEVFDLRRPELWEQYQKYLKEVYDIIGRPPYITPAMDKVC